MSRMAIRLSLIMLLAVELTVVSAGNNFDFFYFVLQWPGAYCNTGKKCCFPKTGKPKADFGIHGLWPKDKSGGYPSSCHRRKPFDPSKVMDLLPKLRSEWPSLECPSGDGIKFWSHEWKKHGNCAPALDEHAYFKAGLDLKAKLNPLKVLTAAGIKPNGTRYHLRSIKLAIRKSVGHRVYVQCNRDRHRNYQIYQLYFCVDTDASTVIDCTVFPQGKCGQEIRFPSF